MRKTLVCLIALLLALGTAEARPRQHPVRRPHRPPPPPPTRVIHHRPRPPSWGWGMNVTPWGGSLSVGRRIGRHGFISTSVPIIPPPPLPVVERERTIIVQQPAQQVIVTEPDRKEAERAAKVSTVSEPAILPVYAPKADGSAKTWVDGHWRVTRGLDGEELTRTWVPGHWE